MVKPAKGFMTDDGNFFETEPEAEFHEAETRTAMMGAQCLQDYEQALH
jgi:hypothetical protein